MAKGESQRFPVYVTKGKPNRGSKLWSVIVVVALLAIAGTGYYFWAMDDRLVEHIRKQDEIAVVAAWALYAKGRTPAEAYEPLIGAMETGKPSLRAIAAKTLGTYRRRELVALLIHAMTEDEEASVRAAAAQALGENGDTDNPTLIASLRIGLADEAVVVRAAAAGAVGPLELERLIPELIGLLGDDHESVKKAAKISLETFTPEGISYEFNRTAWSEWHAGDR